ncbi:hypothetical protein BD410DRAFT_767359 [Rickenella mellea]|uniref:Amidohydrolase 3 domain-containing protein n=1 Tax=Rickenella mellea TaxID=50990 RepID=A0A4Y7QAD1_9AGAM|nr:hypothetical protein BD410DRAFT_767359 [Rickenella mellea]
MSRISVESCAVTIIIAAVLWIFRKPGVTHPTSYALCSKAGANIYTVDGGNSKVECIVVHDSRILDTGSHDAVTERWRLNNQLLPGIEPSTDSETALKTIYIPENAIVVPGLSDSHAHVLEYGANRILPLDGVKDSTAVVHRVRDYIKSNPDVLKNKTHFIEGWGWDHTSWPTEKWPSAAELESDPVCRGRPIVLQSKDGHALWVSARILEAMSPLPETVEGGVIVRNEVGEPTGVLLDNAQDLVPRLPLTEEDLDRRFKLTVKDALAKGLTSVHDAGFDPVSLAFFKRYAQRGNLPIRIYGMTYFNESGEYQGNKLQKVIDAGNGRFSARSIKIFADGALRSGGAALYEPYSDNPGTSGFMRLSTELLNEVIPKFLKDGWQVNVHAIGDRANGIVLDAFESALKDVDVSALRPRLEHAQILTRSDMKRLGRLGVMASVQPTHAISDMWYAENRLGPERVKMLYAFRTLIDSGATITLGSDFPVEDLNPLSGFYAAITRLSPDGRSPHGPGGWFPEERLTREEALRGMTINPAYASFTESSLGSLEPGKRADYVVLSQDIMTIPAERILETKVLATVLDGTPAYGEL